jgi:hypothetical protein
MTSFWVSSFIFYIARLPPCIYIGASRLRPPQVPLFLYLGPEPLAEEGTVGGKSARFGDQLGTKIQRRVTYNRKRHSYQRVSFNI